MIGHYSKVPQHFIVMVTHFSHSVSEDGLLEGAADIFIGQKKAEDYHSEMNGVHFEKYIE